MYVTSLNAGARITIWCVRIVLCGITPRPGLPPTGRTPRRALRRPHRSGGEIPHQPFCWSPSIESVECGVPRSLPARQRSPGRLQSPGFRGCGWRYRQGSDAAPIKECVRNKVHRPALISCAGLRPLHSARRTTMTPRPTPARAKSFLALLRIHSPVIDLQALAPQHEVNSEVAITDPAAAISRIRPRGTAERAGWCDNDAPSGWLRSTLHPRRSLTR